MTVELKKIQQQIRDYEEQYSRAPHSVSLLAVSKQQPLEKILSVIAEGQHAFGENYLQEALKKMAVLPKEIEWHFIGPLQSNKTRKIAEQFAWVHSVTSFHLAKRLSDQRPQSLAALNICIEINLQQETSKSGILASETFALAKEILTLPRLKLRGLMAIPKPSSDIQSQRNALHPLVLLFQSLCEHGIALDTLSMGMSDDLEAAIAEGATIVRVGTALFGERINALE